MEAYIQTPYRDGKRVLECLQKSLRIASSSIDELTSVQLYVDALDRYIYYFEQGVEAVTPKYVNSLVELIVGNIDNISVGATGGGYEGAMGGGRRGGGEGLVEGVQSPEMVVKVSCRALMIGPVCAIADQGSTSEIPSVISLLGKDNMRSGKRMVEVTHREKKRMLL